MDSAIIGTVLIVAAVLGFIALLMPMTRNMPPQPPPEPPRKDIDLAAFSRADWSSVAQDYVYEKVSLPASWSAEFKDCDRADSQIANLRSKYQDLQPPPLREAVMSWLDYYQQRANRARVDARQRERVKALRKQLASQR